jgi:predicted DNA-binding transcriptional regulator YafY
MSEPQTTKGSMLCRLSVVTRKVRFTYTNWRGETSERIAEPTDIWYGSSEWHPEPQWFLSACDLEKDAMRDFAIRDMKDATYVE